MVILWLLPDIAANPRLYQVPVPVMVPVPLTNRSVALRKSPLTFRLPLLLIRNSFPVICIPASAFVGEFRLT